MVQLQSPTLEEIFLFLEGNGDPDLAGRINEHRKLSAEFDQSFLQISIRFQSNYPEELFDVEQSWNRFTSKANLVY